MESWTQSERWRRGVLWAAGLGALAGALEMVSLASSSRLPMSWIDAAVLGALTAFGMALVGMLASAVAGIVQFSREHAPAHRNLALQLGITTFVLACWYLLPLAEVLVREERLGAAAAMLGMAMTLAGGVLFNARYWLARAELGKPSPVGWGVVSSAVSLGVIGLAAALWSGRDTGGGYALKGDPNVLLITLDGTPRSSLAPWGGEGEALTALAQRGVVFDDAIVPSPSSLAVHGSLLTGLHPLRHRGIDDRYRPPRGLPTVATALEAEGWATGAFVSSITVAHHAQLHDGFRVYDDAIDSGLRGASLVRVLSLVGSVLGEGRVVRPGAETVAAFEGWLGDHAEVPWFAWVHLADAMVGQGGDEDALIGRMVEALDAAGVTERTQILVAGAAGPVDAKGGSLVEARVQRPLLVVSTEHGPRRVDGQVRAMDVAQTVVTLAGLDPLPQVAGVDLGNYLAGTMNASLFLSLVARDAGDWVLGARTQGVKYLADLDGEGEVLYELATDPTESTDLSLEQPEALSKARSLILAERTALQRIIDEGPVADRVIDAKLRALGYRE